MKIIEINDVAYNIPTNWEEITMGMFEEFYKIQTSNTSGLTKTFQSIEVLTKIPIEILKETDASIIGEIFEPLKFIFISTDIPQTKEIHYFKLDGEEFKVNQDLSRSSLNEWMLYDHFQQNYSGINALPYLIAILAKKEGETLKDKDESYILEKAERMRKISIATAISIGNFFLNREKRYIQHSQLFFQMKEMKRRINEREKQLKMNLTKNGDGMGLLRRLQEKIILKYLKFLINR